MNTTLRVASLSLFAAVLGGAACGKSPSNGGFGAAAGGGGPPPADDAAADAGSSFFPTSDDGGFGTFGGDGGPGAGALAEAGCATATAEAKRQPVYMMFVLDGSGSMAMQNKWAAVVPALQSIFGDMQSKADPGVGAGLIVFADTMDSTLSLGPYPGSNDVSISFVSSMQGSALTNRLSGMPVLTTPTQAALTGGYGELESFQAMSPLTPGGKKVLVLITDGVPTDGCATVGQSDYTSNACVMMAGQKLMEAAPMGPILTFVIGVGAFPSSTLGEFDPSFLGNLAKAGGSAPMGCNPNENSNLANICYFEVDPTQSSSAMQLQQHFEDAINTIRGQVISCSFPLQSMGLADPNKVNVEVNGMTVLQDPNDGWTYDDPTHPTTIILHGAACMNVKSTIMVKVSIVIGCATQKVM